MSLGIFLLIAVGVLILLGLAQQVLDRMYLNDTQALIFLGAMVAGSFVNIPLYRGIPEVSLNVGGALLPIGLAVYVFSRAGTSKETARGIFSLILTGAVIYGLSKVYDFDIDSGFIEPQYLWGIVAGLLACLISRSRRSAFISATGGILLSDIAHAVEAIMKKSPSPTRIGGAGALDTLVLSGIIAVLLTEIIGESRERLQGGPVRSPDRSERLQAPEKEGGKGDE